MPATTHRSTPMRESPLFCSHPHRSVIVAPDVRLAAQCYPCLPLGIWLISSACPTLACLLSSCEQQNFYGDENHAGDWQR